MGKFAIDKKIIGYKVVEKGSEAVKESLPEIAPNEKVVQILTESMLGERIPRRDKIYGTTYRIKPGNCGDSYYITLNSQEIDGHLHPMEVFINSKNVEHLQWISTITRLISAVFRRGGNVDFIVEELLATHDPAGGYWGTQADRKTGKKKYYKSMLNEIGEVIEDFLGSIAADKHQPRVVADKQDKVATGKVCPDCKGPSLVLLDGCPTCLDCGYSKCG